MGQRVIEEVESMGLNGCLDGKVFEGESQVPGLATLVSYQTDGTSSPWNWGWGGGSPQDHQGQWIQGRER